MEWEDQDDIWWQEGNMWSSSFIMLMCNTYEMMQEKQEETELETYQSQEPGNWEYINWEPDWEMVEKINRASRDGRYNRFRLKELVKNHWNFILMRSLLEGYDNIEVVEWLQYGWPIGRNPQGRTLGLVLARK